MTDDLNREARSLEPLALETRRRQGPGHPSTEKLVAYQECRLAPGERDEIQGHLAVCPECTQELLELTRLDEAFEDDEPAVGGTRTPGETEASWQALRARLADPPLQAKRVVVLSRFRRWTTSPWTAPALAAALIACLIGFPLWIFLHRAPVATRPLILIQPGAFEITRGTEDSRKPISVPLGDATAVLSLPVPGHSFMAYRIEIQNPHGQEPLLSVTPVLLHMASHPGVPPSAEGDGPGRLVSFGLPRGSLAPGVYRLRVVGLANGTKGEILVEHQIRVVKP